MDNYVYLDQEPEPNPEKIIETTFNILEQIKNRRNDFKKEIKEAMEKLSHEQLCLFLEVIEEIHPGLMFWFISNKWRTIVESMNLGEIQENIIQKKGDGING